MGAAESEALRIELTRVTDISGVDAPTKVDVSIKTEDAESASAALRRAIAVLHEADDAAWKRYATDLEHATLRFDAALGMAAANLRTERAASKPELEQALEAVARSWRTRADEIRVQTHLGELEARDAGLHTVEDLERAGHKVASVLEVLRSDAAASLGSLREAAGRAYDEVGLAVSDLRPRHRE
ncbi:hypothetical protein BH10ACT1_BH10ACT1_22770 [soil metagenome]